MTLSARGSDPRAVIRLKNLLREPRTYEIPISANAGHVRMDVTTVKRSLARPTGDAAPAGSLTLQTGKPRTVRKVLPPSVTLMAAGTEGDTSDVLPDHVQHVEPFASLIARRALVVLPEAKPSPEASAPAPQLSAAPETKPESPTPQKPEKRGGK